MAAVDAFRRRGQPEAIRCQAVLGGERVGCARQVMTLVEHHHAETRAEVLHVREGGVVGRHGDRLDPVVAAADDADVAPQAVGQQPVPLRDQIEGGRDHERVPPHLVEGQQCDLGLPGPRGQDDHAAALRGPPRLQRLRLEGARFAAHLQPLVEHAVLPRPVLAGDPLPNEFPHHPRIGDGGCAKPPRAGVPAAGVRQRRALFLGQSADVQGTGDEVQANGQSLRECTRPRERVAADEARLV